MLVMCVNSVAELEVLPVDHVPPPVWDLVSLSRAIIALDVSWTLVPGCCFLCVDRDRDKEPLRAGLSVIIRVDV